MPGKRDGGAEVRLTRDSLPGCAVGFFFPLLTSGLADHDVAVFALAAVVEALHLDVVGGLGLEVSDHVPVLHT